MVHSGCRVAAVGLRSQGRALGTCGAQWGSMGLSDGAQWGSMMGSMMGLNDGAQWGSMGQTWGAVWGSGGGGGGGLRFHPPLPLSCPSSGAGSRGAVTR